MVGWFGGLACRGARQSSLDVLENLAVEGVHGLPDRVGERSPAPPPFVPRGAVRATRKDRSSLAGSDRSTAGLSRMLRIRPRCWRHCTYDPHHFDAPTSGAREQT